MNLIREINEYTFVPIAANWKLFIDAIFILAILFAISIGGTLVNLFGGKAWAMPTICDKLAVGGKFLAMLCACCFDTWLLEPTSPATDNALSGLRLPSWAGVNNAIDVPPA